MSLSYCSLHTRLFSRRYARWGTFSQATINEIQGYYDLLRSTHADASHLEVVERSCDQCEAAFRQISPINGNGMSA